MPTIGKVIGIASLAGFTALAGCAADPGESVDGTDGPTGSVSQPLRSVNGWSVNAEKPVVPIGFDDSLISRGVFKNNSTSSGSRRAGTVLARATGASCARDEDCDANGGAFCLQQDNPIQPGKRCYEPVSAEVGWSITLAPGQSTDLVTQWQVDVEGPYATVALLNKDNGYGCAYLTSRQDPATCARSVSRTTAFWFGGHPTP